MIDTTVPPASGPAFCVTALTLGGGTKLNRSAALVADVPLDVVTLRSTGTEPKLAVVPRPKPVPVIETVVPPACGPALGVTAVTVGTAS